MHLKMLSAKCWPFIKFHWGARAIHLLLFWWQDEEHRHNLKLFHLISNSSSMNTISLPETQVASHAQSIYISLSSGAHSTNVFSIAIQIQWKFSFTRASILTKWALQNSVHDMTAVLSWQVQKFIAIWRPAIELQQGEVSLEFELRAKNCWWNESLMQTSQLHFL